MCAGSGEDCCGVESGVRVGWFAIYAESEMRVFCVSDVPLWGVPNCAY